MRRTALVQAALLPMALLAAACGGGSFRVVPTDIPKVSTGMQVTTTDGEAAVVPERFDARLVLDESRGRLMVREDDDKRARWISEPLVDQAEQAGWSTTRFETENVLEADWGRPEARLAAGSSSAAPGALGPHTTLWLRNDQGKEAEVPLGAVESMDVRRKRAPGSKAVWIVPAAVGGALLVAALAVGFASYVDGVGHMK